MDENMNTSATAGVKGADGVMGEEGVATATDAGTEEVKATEHEQESGASFSDAESMDGGAEPPEKAQPDETKKSEQSAGERAINAFRRRETERKEEMQRVREEAILEALGGVNPFTGEQMKDSTDISQYLEMREIKNRGGDPVGEYAKYHKIMERERVQREAEEERKRTAEANRQAAHDRDMQAFREKHPNVTVQSMMNDSEFMAYAKGRVGKEGSVFAVYDAYVSAKAAEEARVERRAKELAAQMQANASASPGTAVGTAGTSQDVFTIEQIKGMSRAEVKKNYDKICKSLNYWK